MKKQKNELVKLPWEGLTADQRRRREKRFVWDDDDDDGLIIIRYDEEARKEVEVSLREGKT